MKSIRVLIAAAAGASLAGCAGMFEDDASAGSSAAASRSAPSFQNLDANNDGQVSLAESAADTRISRDFTSADKDGNGGLTMEEFKAALKNTSQ